MSSIAFIVHSKNEEEVVRFCTLNKPLLANTKILATKTDKNKIESVLDRKINFTSSLESKGDVSVASKASKGEVAAIFYFSPPNDALPGLISLIHSCNKKKVYLALDAYTGDTVIQMLVSEKVLTPAATGAMLQRKETVNKHLTQSKSSKYTTGMIEFSPVLNKAEMWSNQQLLYFLTQNDLDYLRAVYLDTGPAEKGTKAELFTKHETKSNLLQVKSGSVPELIELLTLSDSEALRNIFEYDHFVRDWLMTFHSFSNPKEFLDLLKQRYHQCFEESDPEDAIESAKAVMFIIKLWVRMEFAADFALDETLCNSLKRFLDKEVSSKLPALSSETREFLEKNLEIFKNKPEPDLKHAPQPIIPKRGKDATSLGSISDVDPLEIARQITVMEANVFRELRAKEFVRTAWTKKNARDIAPKLTQFIELSNRVSQWIVTEILKLKAYEEMAELIVKFIKVGRHMLLFNNFSGVIEVVTALNNPAIGKLKGAWILVPTKNKDILEEISEIISPLGHYKNYRFAFHHRNIDQPCIPILAATLSDLNGYEEVFSNTTTDGAVNWAKMIRIASRIWETLSINAYYEFKPVPMIQEYIMSSTLWSDSLTTCAIADLREKNIAKQIEQKDANKRHSKRRSTSNMSLYIDQEDGARDQLSDKDWSYLITTAEEPKSYKKGQVILEAGSPNDKLYRIKCGSVKVVKEVNGVETAVATMKENAMFGEVSMLLRSQKGTATASIVADGDVEVWVLDIEFVLTLIESKPFLAEKLNRILAIKLAQRLRDLGNTKKSSDSNKKSRRLKEDQKDSDDKLDKATTEKSKIKENVDKFLKRVGLEEVAIRYQECSLKLDANFRGTLVITPIHIGFFGRVFGRKEQFYFPFTAISDIKKNSKYLIINRKGDEVALNIHDIEDREELFTFLNSMWHYQSTSNSKRERKKSEKKLKTEVTKDIKSSWLPSPSDWDVILKGARTVTYQKDDVIMKDGERVRRIYQLLNGECRFEKVIDGQTKVLGYLGNDGSDHLFGEISFLEGGKASASVVCDKDNTQISIIEGYFLEVLFQYTPELSGRFYHYLAHILSKRLKQREAALQQNIQESNSDQKDKKKKKHDSQKSASRS